MSTTLLERELSFTFPDVWHAEKFDDDGKGFPKHIAPVDFIVERANDILLIEVKDPSASSAPGENRAAFARKMETKELTHEELVPKARTTWSYLHLMERTTKPLTYLVVIGADALSIQPPLLQSLGDRLRKRLAHEAREPWRVAYIASCAVVSAVDLPRFLPEVTVSRVTPVP